MSAIELSPSPPPLIYALYVAPLLMAADGWPCIFRNASGDEANRSPAEDPLPRPPFAIPQNPP